MLDHTTPLALTISYMAVALTVYLLRNRRTYRAHARYQGIDDDQRKRFAIFPHSDRVERLQTKTNAWHELAITAKTKYEGFGVAACSGAPALILLHAVEPFLQRAGLISEFGINLANAFVAVAVFLILWVYRHPSRPHIEARLRAELLRSELHCLLAGVGPYANDPPVDALNVTEVDRMAADSILERLVWRERACRDQAAHKDRINSFPEFGAEHAGVYVVERVGEQGEYFPQSANRLRRAYERSSRAVMSLVTVAALAGVANVVIDQMVASEVLSCVYLTAGSTVVMLVSLRAVFGWDSKAALSVRQERLLLKLDQTLRSNWNSMVDGHTEAAWQFRRTAAEFEALMAREACDWCLISDREAYDITL